MDEWATARELSEIEAIFEPDDARHEQALAGYARFTDAYARLREWFAPDSI